MKYTAIFYIKTSLQELVQECLTLFGEGANVEFEQTEYAFSLNNGLPQQGYIRVPVAEHIAYQLQYMQDNNIISEHADLIRVEWHGQDQICYEFLDDEGNLQEGYREELFRVGDVADVDGVMQPEYLGRIG